jgi:hypothetical protein
MRLEGEMKIFLVLIVLFTACTAPIKQVKQPDKVIEMDGDFIAGCAQSIIYMVTIDGTSINEVAIDAYCMQIYLQWLEAKNH